MEQEFSLFKTFSLSICLSLHKSFLVHKLHCVYYTPYFAHLTSNTWHVGCEDHKVVTQREGEEKKMEKEGESGFRKQDLEEDEKKENSKSKKFPFEWGFLWN